MTVSMLQLRTSLVILLGVLAAGLPAQQPSATDSGKASKALESIAAAALERGFPGVVLAGSLRDGPLLTGAAGLADRSREAPMTAGSLLHGASTTKIFTAVSVLLLVEQDRLSLDTPVVELLSEELCDGIPHIDRIRVRDLLLHTSGLYSPHKDPRFFARFGHQFGPDGENKGFLSATEIARATADPNNPPAFAPGKGQGYNGFNYVLLELILEAVSGQPLPELVNKQILDPLGLQSTYYLSTDRTRHRARGYTVDSSRIRRMGLHPSLKADAGGFVDTTGSQDESNGGSGIITSMPDLVRFARAAIDGTLLNKTSTKLLLAVLDQAKESGGAMKLGILRATKMPIGLVALALGNGFGTHVVWAYHPESSAIVAIGINQFGAWNEASYFMGTLIPEALKAVIEQ